jgi:hypothetical protein
MLPGSTNCVPHWLADCLGGFALSMPSPPYGTPNRWSPRRLGLPPTSGEPPGRNTRRQLCTGRRARRASGSHDPCRSHGCTSLERRISRNFSWSWVLPQVAPSATTKQTSARTVNLTQRGAPRSLPLSDNQCEGMHTDGPPGAPHD